MRRGAGELGGALVALLWSGAVAAQDVAETDARLAEARGWDVETLTQDDLDGLLDLLDTLSAEVARLSDRTPPSAPPQPRVSASQLDAMMDAAVRARFSRGEASASAPTTALARSQPAGAPRTQTLSAVERVERGAPVHHHTVVKGDTLYNISRRQGIDVPTLQSLNAMTDTVIHVGERLVVVRPMNAG